MSGAFLLLNCSVAPASLKAFSAWQEKLHAALAAAPGFLSLKISAPKGAQPHWVLIQGFSDEALRKNWELSDTYKQLLSELREHIMPHGATLSSSAAEGLNDGVATEIFVTEVYPEQVATYQEWVAKMHGAEALFPGFRGVYVQTKGSQWVTVLQFDSHQELEAWLQSAERQALLTEGKALIASMQAHQLTVSPFAGWFSSLHEKAGVPPVWKQTMLILLVLFPVVMLEMFYLSPWLKSWHPASAMFLSNAISVTLVSWPLLPLAIYFLKPWLLLPAGGHFLAQFLGTLFVLLLYALEVAFFWLFF